jgi:hypothetical protein
LPRPTVFEIRSGHEGAMLTSYYFEAFRTEAGIHSTMSPPNDHDRGQRPRLAQT